MGVALWQALMASTSTYFPRVSRRICA